MACGFTSETTSGTSGSLAPGRGVVDHDAPGGDLFGQRPGGRAAPEADPRPGRCSWWSPRPPPSRRPARSRRGRTRSVTCVLPCPPDRWLRRFRLSHGDSLYVFLPDRGISIMRPTPGHRQFLSRVPEAGTRAPGGAGSGASPNTRLSWRNSLRRGPAREAGAVPPLPGSRPYEGVTYASGRRSRDCLGRVKFSQFGYGEICPKKLPRAYRGWWSCRFLLRPPRPLPAFSWGTTPSTTGNAGEDSTQYDDARSDQTAWHNMMLNRI
ncbi:hypothetical protein SCANM63S_00784 [Streptomyces canarius]